MTLSPDCPEASLEPARSPERRRDHRAHVSVRGRCMLQDHTEFDCHTLDLSPMGASVAAPPYAMRGERVVIWFDRLGRVGGRVVRATDRGFVVAFDLSDRRRTEIAALLAAWEDGRPQERRRSDRDEPPNPWSHLTLADGTALRCTVVDISLVGAAVRVDPPPPVGADVVLGRIAGRVVRRTADGVAVAFVEDHTVPIGPA